MLLSRERASSHVILAHVQDAAMPEWECVSRVEVAVMDVNDNEPKFAQVSAYNDNRLIDDLLIQIFMRRWAKK